MYTYAPLLKLVTHSCSSHVTVPHRTRTRIFLALGHLNPPTSSFTYSIYVACYPLKLCAGGFSLKIAHNVPTSSGPRDDPVGLKRAYPVHTTFGIWAFSGPRSCPNAVSFGEVILRIVYRRNTTLAFTKSTKPHRWLHMQCDFSTRWKSNSVPRVNPITPENVNSPRPRFLYDTYIINNSGFLCER